MPSEVVSQHKTVSVSGMVDLLSGSGDREIVYFSIMEGSDNKRQPNHCLVLGAWSPLKRLLPVNILELHWSVSLEGFPVRVQSDITTAMVYIKHQGAPEVGQPRWRWTSKWLEQNVIFWQINWHVIFLINSWLWGSGLFTQSVQGDLYFLGYTKCASSGIQVQWEAGQVLYKGSGIPRHMR